MTDIQKTRFIAANYANLQGLHAVPLGLLLLGVVLWANARTGAGTNLAVPLLMTLGMLLLAFGIRRYYDMRFGRVETAAKQKKLEILLGVAGGVVALCAFLADIRFHLPFSCIGLVFAASFLAEYGRMQQVVKGRYLLPNTLVYTLLVILVSLLPLLGLSNWWEWLGLRAQLSGVLAVVSVLIVISGLLGHWFFVRQLPRGEG